MYRTAALNVGLFLVVGHALVAGAEDPLTPQGPGHTFPTVEAAAIDALAFAHLVEGQADGPRVSRGGGGYSRNGGLTYRSLRSASPASPEALSLPLGPRAVAHFHTYPRRGGQIDRRNERHSKADREIVDELDPKHRPSYVLTPSLRVVVYRGRHDARSSEEMITRVEPVTPGTQLAGH